MSFNTIEGNDLTVKTEKKFIKIELNDKPDISIIETESQELLERQEVKSKNKKGKTE